MNQTLEIDIDQVRTIFGHLIKSAIRDYLYYISKPAKHNHPDFLSAKSLLFDDNYVILWDDLDGDFYLSPSIIVDIAFKDIIDIDILRERIRYLEKQIIKHTIQHLETINLIIKKEIIND